MSHADKEAPKSGELPTKSELAKSWLNYHKDEIGKKIKERRSTAFNLRNENQPPIKPANLQSGSMADFDWRVLKLEYDKRQDKAMEEIEAAEDKIEEGYVELEMVTKFIDWVEEGDSGLIERFSILEQERRDKIEAERKEKESRGNLDDL